MLSRAKNQMSVRRGVVKIRQLSEQWEALTRLTPPEYCQVQIVMIGALPTTPSPRVLPLHTVHVHSTYLYTNNTHTYNDTHSVCPSRASPVFTSPDRRLGPRPRCRNRQPPDYGWPRHLGLPRRLLSSAATTPDHEITVRRCSKDARAYIHRVWGKKESIVFSA